MLNVQKHNKLTLSKDPVGTGKAQGIINSKCTRPEDHKYWNTPIVLEKYSASYRTQNHKSEDIRPTIQYGHEYQWDKGDIGLSKAESLKYWGALRTKLAIWSFSDVLIFKLSGARWTAINFTIVYGDLRVCTVQRFYRGHGISMHR